MSADRSARSAAIASGRNGAVAAGHPAAAAAALDVLRSGGNAVDAAIAGSAMQCVVEMPWCGVAGDAFAMVRSPSGEVAAFNGSGAAPLGILPAMGDKRQVPRHGPLSVGVPGLVDAWSNLAARYGTRPVPELLAPAVRAADDGVAWDARLRAAFEALGGAGGDESLRADLLAASGAVFRQPDLASTLQAIVDGGRDAFYGGPLAQRIAGHVQALGGALTVGDMEAHHGSWAEPASARFRDTVVSVQPPVSMGVLLLCALRLIERSAPSSFTADMAERTGFLVAVKHSVFGAALAQLGDPAFVDDRTASLLSDEWVDAQLHRDQVAPVAGGGADTTSLAVVDADGMAVSFIHSLFNEFGSRVLVPGTGLVLNDRLANLRTDPTPRNALHGGKRPMHTLHSWIAERADGTVLAGATPGGRGQVQTNLQVLLGVVEDGLDLPSSVSRPRWVNGLPRRAPDDDTLYLEWDFDPAAAASLGSSGHRIEFMPEDADDHFGACTIVQRSGEQCLAVGDHRRDCAAVAW